MTAVVEAGADGRCDGCGDPIQRGDELVVLAGEWFCEGCIDGLVFDAMEDFASA
jgi:formylmethanofuran dehydrogenase subunit E